MLDIRGPCGQETGVPLRRWAPAGLALGCTGTRHRLTEGMKWQYRTSRVRVGSNQAGWARGFLSSLLQNEGSHQPWTPGDIAKQAKPHRPTGCQQGQSPCCHTSACCSLGVLLTPRSPFLKPLTEHMRLREDGRTRYSPVLQRQNQL